MNIFNKILGIGTQHAQNPQERRTVRMTNLINVFFILMCTGCLLGQPFFKQAGIDQMYPILIALDIICVSSLLLNHLGRFLLGKILCMGSGMASAFYAASSLGVESLTMVIFVGQIPMVALLFTQKEKIWRFIFFMIPFILFGISEQADYHLFETFDIPNKDFKSMRWTNMLFCMVVLVGIIISFINNMESSEKKLHENIKEMQQTQKLLEIQKNEIESAYKELKTTQNYLIQSEKMAGLGQLVASIAHEINTPLGAIKASSQSVRDVLLQTLFEFPLFIRKLDDSTLEAFFDILNKINQPPTLLTTREARAIKRQWVEKLEDKELEDIYSFADRIVDMNLYNEEALIMKILEYKNGQELIQVTHNFSIVFSGNRTVREAVSRASKTVLALKTFAHKSQDNEKTPVNINQELDTTLTLYHNKLKYGIEVHTDYGKIPEFMGYSDELTQVWTNLIHNAIQAMKEKGKLIISTKNENDKVLVSIQDTGGGIPKEVQDKIFDAFFTTKIAGEGSGLGLDITKKIIDKHEGKIWFESEEGIGTTFFVEIPILQ